jgi:predicted nuclease of predicted toxin-antitoxin system
VSRLLADENIPQPAVIALRAAGHDIRAILEDTPGAADEEVLATARAQARILLTFDLDMGQLVGFAPHALLPLAALCRRARRGNLKAARR